MAKLFTPYIYADWMGITQREKIAELLKKVKLKKYTKVLDVGSGHGFLGEFIDDFVAVDVDAVSLHRNKGKRVLASGNQLPFADSSFDAVFCLDTVHLLSGSDELGRVVKKRGHVVITRYCSEYNKMERMVELKALLAGWEVLDEFVVGSSEREMDAVVVCRPRER